MSKENYNITVIGAGLTGLAFCNLMKGSKINTKLIDSNSQSFYNNIKIDRYIVLSNTSKLILESLDLWKEISIHCSNIRNIHISKKNIFGSTLVKSKDEDLESLGYQVPIKKLIKILYNNIAKESNIEILHEAEVIEVDPGENVKISYTHKSKVQNTLASSVIFSTGATGSLVDSLFPEKVQKDYDQNALVCEIISDKFNCDTAFERFTDLGILGIIPRKENIWTLIYSTSHNESEHISNLDNSNVISYFQDLLGNKCGTLKEVNNINVYPLQMKYYKNFTRENICLLGDAAHTLHPIAAQSFNLSLRDCVSLTNLIKQEILEKDSFKRIFKNYLDERNKEFERIIKFTDTLASFIHGGSFIKNNILSLSFLAMDMNKNLRINIIRYLLGVNFSKSLLSTLKE